MTTVRDESRNILEEGRLHHLMVFFQQVERLPAVAIPLLQLACASLAAASWSIFSAPPAVLILAAASVAGASFVDTLVFCWLPRARISFGPWKAQTVVLLVPRTTITLLLPLLSAVLQWPATLLLLMCAQALGTLLLWWAAAIEPRRLALTQLQVGTGALSPQSKPIKLLHISDIHLERMTEREEQLLLLVSQAEPDLIVITGDFLNLSYNADPLAKQQVKHLLSQLQAPYGVYATLGSPPVDLRSEIVPVLESLPLCLLRDEWVQVEQGTGASIVLMGIDCTHHLDLDGAQLSTVAQSAPSGMPRVLLYHSPELMPAAVKLGIDLYLCGHTHGGQVRLPLIGPILTSSQLGRRFVMGLYKEGRTQLYVSRGVGLEGLSAPRVRLLAPPEITLVTLYSNGGCEVTSV